MYDPNIPTGFGHRDGEQPADAAPQSDEGVDDALRTAREILQQSLYMRLSGRPNSSHLVDTQIVERIAAALRVAASTTAPAERTRVEGEELAIQIVGTVFDNTAASHETLKQTMIERITDWLAAAPADNDAESLELLRTAAVLCISGDGQPRVSLLFKELKDAQAVHEWLVKLVHGKSTTTKEDR